MLQSCHCLHGWLKSAVCALSGLMLNPPGLSLSNLLEPSYLVASLQGLKLAQFASEECAPNVASTSYDLYAVSNHIGSLVGGHYTAHCLTRTPQVCHTTVVSSPGLLPAC